MSVKWVFSFKKSAGTLAIENSSFTAKSESLFLKGGRENLLVLIHGLTGAPYEMRCLANFFHKKDHSVLCPRLANHGKPLDILKNTTWQEFYESVRSDFLRCLEDTPYTNVYVSGLSMGALLALLLAEEFPERIRAVSCLSPTLLYDGWNVPWYQRLLPLAYHTSLKHFAYFKEDPPYGIKNESLRQRVHQYFENAKLNDMRMVEQYGYAYFPVTLLCELQKLVTHLTPKLSAIKIPVQIVQAVQDDMTSIKNAQFVYDRISSAQKEIVLLENSYHIVTADNDREKVLRKMGEFFKKTSGKSFSHSTTPEKEIYFTKALSA